MKRAAVLLAAAAIGAAVAWQSGAASTLARWAQAQTTPQLIVPDGWPQPAYDFRDNPVTREGFALGRKLFYDPVLSRDGSIACANCHQQFVAFAHAGHRLSHGLGGVDGTRNAPGIFNLAWQPDFMWDGAVHSLELQPLAPLANPREMGETLDNVIRKLEATDDYPARFAAAFGSPGIDSQRLLRAMAQFMGTMVSANARYDAYRSGKDAFTDEEREGLDVFRTRCASCHQEPLFTDHSFRNNGLDLVAGDPGRAGITGDPNDHGKFRVPSLRNVAMTAPYMHDGRFATLEQVLEHYSSGIQDSATRDPLLTGGLHLSSAQRKALIAFLNTLSDESFVDDPRFADAGD